MVSLMKEPKENRDKILSVRMKQSTYDLLELMAIRQHSYTASFARGLLLEGMESHKDSLNAQDSASGKE